MNAARQRLLFLASFVCLVLVGCVDSDSPLSDPAAAKPDERLAGVWRLRGEDGQVTYYHIGHLEGKLPKSVMGVVSVTHKQGTVGAPGELLIFPSALGDKTYLNITGGKKESLQAIHEKGWKAADAYFIFKYRVDGDKLSLWIMDGEVKRRAIEGGKIKGVIEKKQLAGDIVKFTDTTENVARFVAEAGDSLFAKEPVQLERVAAGTKP